jgi:hypothetical protein
VPTKFEQLREPMSGRAGVIRVYAMSSSNTMTMIDGIENAQWTPFLEEFNTVSYIFVYFHIKWKFISFSNIFHFFIFYSISLSQKGGTQRWKASRAIARIWSRQTWRPYGFIIIGWTTMPTISATTIHFNAKYLRNWGCHCRGWGQQCRFMGMFRGKTINEKNVHWPIKSGRN